MKKFFNVRITALLLALCCVFGSFAVVPAYAMEYDNNSENVAVCEDASVMPRAGHDILYYGQVIDILNGVSGHKITVTGTNLTPYKIVENDPRMHRLIFDISARCSQNVRFRITVKTQYHGDFYTDWETLEVGALNSFTNNPAVTNVNVDLPVSMGEHVWFYFEVSPSNVPVDITQFNVYCD